MVQWLVLFTIFPIVCFIQNMAFTWTSRSRNSGDPSYHRKAAWSSNGIWFICQMGVFKMIWQPLMEGNFLYVFVGGIIYILSTTEGSVYMMRLLLGMSRNTWINVKLKYFFEEKGKRKVGERSE